MGCLSSWGSTLTQRYSVLSESKVLFPNSIKYCQMPADQITEKILQSKIEYVFWWEEVKDYRQRWTYSSSIWICDRMWRNQNWHYDETLNVPVTNVLFHLSEVCFHHLWRSCFLSIASFIASWRLISCIKTRCLTINRDTSQCRCTKRFSPRRNSRRWWNEICVTDGNLFWNVTAANN